MNLILELWKDESGLIMSAETVTLGTVAVLGAVVGINAVGSAVNSEMKEMASAIRSLDQSYAFSGHRGHGAWTAGSCYIQPDVRQSLAEINGDGNFDAKAIQQQVEEERKNLLSPALKPQIPSAATPIPNQIPTTETQKATTEVKEAPENQ